LNAIFDEHLTEGADGYLNAKNRHVEQIFVTALNQIFYYLFGATDAHVISEM
jgi:hypothetical protein